MIGQKDVIQNLKRINALSIILLGPRHWGKKTLLREVYSADESVFEITGNASTFRQSVDRIYETVRPTTYLIPDIDQSNATIQNLLLKVLEEPPQRAKFILSASGNVLPTIMSRCVSIQMQPYSSYELEQFPVDNIFIGMGESPGQRKILSNEGSVDTATRLKDVLSYVNTHPLSFLLKEYRGVEALMKEKNLDHEWFLLLISHLCENGKSLDWLREQPWDNVRYVRKLFMMLYWLERRS